MKANHSHRHAAAWGMQHAMAYDTLQDPESIKWTFSEKNMVLKYDTLHMSFNVK